MSPTWRPEDNRALIEARRLQAEMVESAALLMSVANRLSTLATELSDEAEGDDDER